MFELIKEILKQLIVVGKYRKAKRHEIFKNHIEPLFDMMLIIQKNYRDMFLSVRLKFVQEGITKRELLLHINGERNQLVDIRRLAYATAEALKSSFDSSKSSITNRDRELFKNIKKLSGNIINYFTLSPESHKTGSASFTLLKYLNDELKTLEDDSKISKEKVYYILDKLILHIDNCWSNICDSYAKIKIHVM